MEIIFMIWFGCNFSPKDIPKDIFMNRLISKPSDNFFPPRAKPEFYYRGNEITEFSVGIAKFQLNDGNKLPHPLQQVFQTLSRKTAQRAIPTEGSSRQHKRQLLQSN
jgi:hypothetical protein